MVEAPLNEDAEPGYTVPPVTRAFALLRHIAKGNRCRNASRTAKALSINRTTLIRLLATLEAEGVIETIEDEGGYRLGTGLIALAAEALNERSILQVARPHLRKLVRELNLSAHLGVLEGREIVYLARETPNSHLASTVREGTHLPAHATTIGRILLAELPPGVLSELYRGHAMESFTSRTRTTISDLQAQLQADRERGIAWSIANFEPEIGSAAVAVYDHEARPVGAVNVTGHVTAFAEGSPQVERIEQQLKDTARAISEAMGYRGARAEPAPADQL
jgi:DNA-binding IclR family transcriptional regulator